MHRSFGSMTLSQLAFPRESNLNFPREKSHWDSTVVESKKSPTQAVANWKVMLMSCCCHVAWQLLLNAGLVKQVIVFLFHTSIKESKHTNLASCIKIFNNWFKSCEKSITDIVYMWAFRNGPAHTWFFHELIYTAVYTVHLHIIQVWRKSGKKTVVFGLYKDGWNWCLLVQY